MSCRLEYKYLVPCNQLASLRNHLAAFVEADPYSQASAAGDYTVRSVYCDTISRAIFTQKVDGICMRKKFRVRGYNTAADDSLLFLEIKRKNVNAIDKDRAPLRRESLKAIFSNDHWDKLIIRKSENSNEEDGARNFLYHYYSRRLSPIILIVYEREAFFSKFDHSLRITFDKNIRSRPVDSFDSLFDDTNLRPARPGYFILEVKFWGSLPFWLRSVIRRFGFLRLALSKYTICLDTHKPASGISMPINIRSLGLERGGSSSLER